MWSERHPRFFARARTAVRSWSSVIPTFTPPQLQRQVEDDLVVWATTQPPSGVRSCQPIWARAFFSSAFTSAGPWRISRSAPSALRWRRCGPVRPGLLCGLGRGAVASGLDAMASGSASPPPPLGVDVGNVDGWAPGTGLPIGGSPPAPLGRPWRRLPGPQGDWALPSSSGGWVGSASAPGFDAVLLRASPHDVADFLGGGSRAAPLTAQVGAAVRAAAQNPGAAVVVTAIDAVRPASRSKAAT